MSVLTAQEVIIRPVITEKSIDLAGREPAHRYTF